MDSELKKHRFYYVIIFLIIAMGLILVSQSQYGKGYQLIVVGTIAFCYVLWGIVHHYAHHDITAKIVLEYVLIASLGMVALLFLLQG